MKINKAGYVEIEVDGKRKLEHIQVVEKYIGRKLKKNEIIHHLNEIKHDNRITNLMIFPNQSEHAKWHNKTKIYGYLTRPMLREIEQRWQKI